MILLLRTKTKLLVSLLIGIVLFRFVISSVGFEFPYHDDSHGNPTPQRLFVTHTSRHFYNRNGTLRYSDSGFWMRELDTNARKTIESLSAPGTPIEQNAEFCKNEVFCALPTYSCRQVHTGSFWLAAPEPLIRKRAEFTLVHEEPAAEQIYRMIFKLSSKWSLYSIPSQSS